MEQNVDEKSHEVWVCVKHREGPGLYTITDKPTHTFKVSRSSACRGNKAGRGPCSGPWDNMIPQDSGMLGI